jgi:hypothetical protein
MNSEGISELNAELEALFSEVETEDIENPQLLGDFELLEKYRLTIMELKELGELYADNGEAFGKSTAEGRELHSLRTSYLLEIRNRGLPI